MHGLILTDNNNLMSVGILEKRRLQAEVIKPIYEAMKEELGAEAAQRILGKAIRQAAVDEGRKLASTYAEGSSVERFVSVLPLWQQEEALNIEPLAINESELSFNVTRCRYAEMYKDMGLGEIGHLLSCGRDGSFCEGFAPNLKLTRTQTIMQGAGFCDFRYRVDKDEDSL